MYNKGLQASLIRRFPADRQAAKHAAKALRQALTHSPLNPHHSLAAPRPAYNPSRLPPFPTAPPPSMTSTSAAATKAGSISRSQWSKSVVTPRVIEKTSKKVLALEDGPMVWIDCEMTGLDLENDRIIEIAVIITDGQLRALDEGISFIIHTPKDVLDKMGEWCTEQHGKTGLTKACIDSPHSHEHVEAAVLDYIKQRIPDQRTAVLAGNSVHADAAFLRLEEGRGMRRIIDWLHYRIVDVSSIKECITRWYPDLHPILRRERNNNTEAAHRALDDIRQSILELAQYRQNVFIPPVPLAAPSLPPSKVVRKRTERNESPSASLKKVGWETEEEYLSSEEAGDAEVKESKGTSLTKARKVTVVTDEKAEESV